MTTRMQIVSDSLMSRSRRPRNYPFSRFIRQKDVTEIVPSSRSPSLRIGSPTPRGTSLSDIQRTPCLRARAIIGKTKEFVNAVRNVIKTNGAARAAESDVHRCFVAPSDPYMPARVEQNAEKVLIQLVDEDSITTHLFHA